MQWLLLVALLSLAGVWCQNTNLLSQNWAGIDMVELDAPTWVTNIQRAPDGTHEIYVFGDTYLRTIEAASGPSAFQALAIPDENSWQYSLNDIHTVFVNTSFSGTSPAGFYSVGPTNYDQDATSAFMSISDYYTPVMLFKPNPDPTLPDIQYMQANTNPAYPGMDWSGFLLYAVRVDYTNLMQGDLAAVYAGWIPPQNGNPALSFGLVRGHYNLNLNSTGLARTPIVFNSTNDILRFYTNQYASFNSFYKPYLHVVPLNNNFQTTYIVLCDPNTVSLYVAYDNNGVLTDAHVGGIPITQYPGLKMVSCKVMYSTLKVYVGLASRTNGNGYIAVVDLQNLIGNQVNYYPLPTNFSNPKAIASDDESQSLYIAFNGGDEVIRWNTTINNVTGYQRLPEWLHRSWDGEATIDHVYYVTNEQHSKVFRIGKKDFCPNRCPFWGYCSNGQCACGQGFTLSSDKTTCEWTQYVKEVEKYKTVHGGEIALGIIFMFTFIAAAAGWFMWYRTRRGAYQQVI